MSGSSTGFGTRQGGLAQSYRSGLAARSQVRSAQTQPKFTPANPEVQSWTEMPQATASGGYPNIHALKHPVLMRWVSAFIDFLILIFVTILISFVYGIMIGISGGGAEDARSSGTLLLTITAAWFGYGLLFESSSWQGTPGKKLTGLVITDMAGQRIGFGTAFGRAWGKLLSGLVPLYIPYIMVGITERKQSLHDKMCGTLVFRRSDLVNSNTVFD